MRIYYQKNRWKLILLSAAIVLAFLALFQINRIVQQLKKEEQEKVKLWASAISKKNELVRHTEDFFKKIREEERKRMLLYLEAQKNIIEQPLAMELSFYVKVIEENTTIPIIITNENNLIQITQNVALPDSVNVLSGELLKKFSRETPVEYDIHGLFYQRLYYTESQIYSDLRNVLESFTQSFLSEVTDNSVFVPVLITDSAQTKVIASGNIDSLSFSSPEKLHSLVRSMASENVPIEIMLPDNQKAFVFYEKSSMLTALQYYPMIYIFVAFVFILIAYNFFSAARSSEQNLIWVGMSKETAHQLGTPISSLLAWVEYMKIKNIPEDITGEIEKDINRLETIAQRFSKIGSAPALEQDNIVKILQDSISYLSARTSKKIKYDLILPENKTIMIPVNAALLEWVIENICKNAIDAMGGIGELTLMLTEDNRFVYVDIKDTGKGIPKTMFKTIFKPGFTTKQRGWGLGLSLAKRIVSEYHKGKIFVKSSVQGKGSTFRIMLKKS